MRGSRAVMGAGGGRALLQSLGGFVGYFRHIEGWAWTVKCDLGRDAWIERCDLNVGDDLVIWRMKGGKAEDERGVRCGFIDGRWGLNWKLSSL